MTEITEPLQFVRISRYGVVHVEMPRIDDGTDNDMRLWPVSVIREFATMGPAWALVTQPVLTLCHRVARTAPGFNGRRLDAFLDNELCRACYTLLGEQSHLAFAHPTEPED